MLIRSILKRLCVNIKQSEWCAVPESILFSYRMKGLQLLEVQCLWSWSLVSILQLRVVEWRVLNILILGGTFYLVSSHTIIVYRYPNNTSYSSLVKQFFNLNILNTRPSLLLYICYISRKVVAPILDSLSFLFIAKKLKASCWCSDIIIRIWDHLSQKEIRLFCHSIYKAWCSYTCII